jgi:hypothetical protein
VIPNDYRLPVVLGHPNYLGAFEREHSAPLICLTGAWSALRPTPEGATTIAAEPSYPLPSAATALKHARRLAKRARQFPGVHLAFKPGSPIIVLLVPDPPIRRTWSENIDVLGDAYPELPGALRIELAADMTAEDVTGYAAILEQIIGQET